MSGIKDIRLPSAMRTTPIPTETQPEAPNPMLAPGCIESAIPPTPFELVDQSTGLDIAAEFAEMRKSADEAMCQDVLFYLSAGMSEAAVIDAVCIRRGAEFGVTKEKIEKAVSIAVDLLETQKESSK